jgi:phage repressor protein C with HTH and peptisase S24 domain
MNDDWTPEQEGARLKELLGSRSKAKFAKEAKIPGGASMLSQHLSGHRPISLAAATAYALGLGVRVEDFSPRLARAIADATRTTVSMTPVTAPGAPEVRVPLLANSGSMGMGSDLQHDDVLVGHIALSELWVMRRLRPTNASALRFIHAYGDSMSPTFEDGDILLVDTGMRDPKTVDGVYVMAANDRVYIKRVRQRMDGAMEISSDNITVKTVDVLNGDHAIEILGRVVWCWNGRKL